MAAEERPRTPIHMEEDLDNRVEETFDTDDAQPLTLTLESILFAVVHDFCGDQALLLNFIYY